MISLSEVSEICADPNDISLPDQTPIILPNVD